MGFASKHHCNCGQTFDEHRTVFESREERELQGRPVDPKWMQDQSMTAGMGGLVGDSHMQLAGGSELNDMRNPMAIVGNLNSGNMLMAPQMRQALEAQGYDPDHQGVPGKRAPRIGGPGGSRGGGGQLMIGGPSSGTGSRARLGGDPNEGTVQAYGQNALSLFMTPHKFQ